MALEYIALDLDGIMGGCNWQLFRLLHLGSEINVGVALGGW